MMLKTAVEVSIMSRIISRSIQYFMLKNELVVMRAYEKLEVFQDKEARKSSSVCVHLDFLNLFFESVEYDEECIEKVCEAQFFMRLNIGQKIGCKGD